MDLKASERQQVPHRTMTTPTTPSNESQVPSGPKSPTTAEREEAMECKEHVEVIGSEAGDEDGSGEEEVEEGGATGEEGSGSEDSVSEGPIGSEMELTVSFRLPRIIGRMPTQTSPS